MRSVIALASAVAILAFVNLSIAGKERQLQSATVVYLELAPVDPRSLMQGDYMALRFKIADDAFGRGRSKESEDGRIVVKLDPRNVAAYVRRDGGDALAEGEAVLRYRVRNDEVKFATNAYFFQEGHARYYERARYGEFRAAPDGETILTAMRGEKLEILGPPR